MTCLFVSISLIIHFTVLASQRDSSNSKDNNGAGSGVNGANGANAYGSKPNALDLDAFKVGPYFDKPASKNVTALLGKTAYLNCRVKNLGNKTVSFYQAHKIMIISYTNKRKKPICVIQQDALLAEP